MLSVPVPTLPQSTLGMTPALRGVLFVSHVAARRWICRHRVGDGAGSAGWARARRSIRDRGAAAASPARSPRSSSAAIIYLGNMWWTVEATAYDRYVYKPLDCDAVARARCEADGSTLSDPGWIGSRRVDDFVADHGHLMHLFVLSPALDRLWHLHPNEIAHRRPSNSNCRRCRRESTSCLPISFTPPACRRR